MKNVTITLPLAQMEAVAYAMQLHMFARADKLTTCEKKPDSRGFNVKNAERDFMRTFDAYEAVNKAIHAACKDEERCGLSIL